MDRSHHPSLRRRNYNNRHLIPKRRLVRPARQFQYEVELEANEQNWLFSLDYPLTPPKNTWLQADHQLISREPVNRTIRYTLDSVIFPGAPALDEFESNVNEMRVIHSLYHREELIFNS